MSIHLNEVLNQMRMQDSKGNPQPFEIEFYTCSLTNRTGGELKHIKRAVLSQNDKSFKRIAKGGEGKRKINQFKNQQRNIIDLDAVSSGERYFTKVHIRLIETFNGMPVEW